MRLLQAKYILVSAMVFLATEAVKKKLLDVISICKRDDPELSKCYCINFKNIIPKLKDGVPGMNIIPMDPTLMENMKIEFKETPRVQLTAHLQKVTIYGLSKVYVAKCNAYKTLEGIQVYLDLHYPEIVLKSLYKAVGNILFVGIAASGDSLIEITEIKLQSTWYSTRYLKNNKEYLNYTADIINLNMDKLAIHLNNVFGNNSELNEGINHTINENITELYNDIKLVIFETIRGRIQEIVNNFHRTFPYAMLYPK